MSDPIKTDVLIIGAGPVGLFAVFELGLLDIKAISSTSSTRSAANAPSFIPRSRSTTFRRSRKFRRRACRRLMEQIKPFGPTFHLGEMVESIERIGRPASRVTTDGGEVFDAGSW